MTSVHTENKNKPDQPSEKQKGRSDDQKRQKNTKRLLKFITKMLEGCSEKSIP